jgi:hypothetical protein
VLNNDETAFGTGLRHVVEPYANYTLIPEPNLRPDRLYQFDSVDELDEEDSVRVGVRNRLQTKRGERVLDLADLDVWTTYRFENYPDGQPFTDINWLGELLPVPGLQVNFDGAYDCYNERLDDFNTRATVKSDVWQAYVEHRYRNGDTSLLTADVSFAPNLRWALEAYERYEFEEGRLEEQAYYVARKLDCLGIKVGLSHLPGYTRADGTRRDDEFRAYAQVWLLAFPNVRVGNTPRY